MKIPKKTAENVTFLISQTSNDMRSYIDKEMEALGLTRSQWILLSLLYSVNGCSQQEMATAMGIGKGALGKLARKLEEKGWINRIPSDSDGRVINIFISDKAYPLVGKLVDLMFEDSRRALSGISQEDINTVRGILFRLRGNIADLPPSPKWSKMKGELIESVKELKP
jgi:MarR family transcriptional regulator, transcriptional regulator for hemolysin